MAMGAMAALHGLAWCLGSLQKLPQSCRAVRTGLKDNPLCYCEARMWLIAIRIHTFPPCVKSPYVSYNHHFWASSQPQNRFPFAISGNPLASTPMKVESSKSTPFSRHVIILLFCTKHGSWSVLSRGITYQFGFFDSIVFWALENAITTTKNDLFQTNSLSRKRHNRFTKKQCMGVEKPCACAKYPGAKFTIGANL
jgi:hypothetical protein